VVLLECKYMCEKWTTKIAWRACRVMKLCYCKRYEVGCISRITGCSLLCLFNIAFLTERVIQVTSNGTINCGWSTENNVRGSCWSGLFCTLPAFIWINPIRLLRGNVHLNIQSYSDKCTQNKCSYMVQQIMSTTTTHTEIYENNIKSTSTLWCKTV
jgi:hypothetical protein